MFKYFDKNKKEEINLELFLNVLMEDHLNIKLLREKLEKKMEEQNLMLEGLYNKYSSEDGMTMKDFSKILKWIDILLDDESLEEAFNLFDT